MIFSRFRSHWVFSTAFLLLSSLIGVQPLPYMCSCTPGEYRFKYDGTPTITDLVITEYDVAGNQLNRADSDGSRENDLIETDSNWQAFTYTRPDRMKGAVSKRLVITSSTSDREDEYELVFANYCNVYPAVDVGQKIGPFEIVYAGPAHSPEICPAYKEDPSETAPTFAPTSAPTSAPTFAPSNIPTQQKCPCSPREIKFQINLTKEDPCDSTTIGMDGAISHVKCGTNSNPNDFNGWHVSEYDTYTTQLSLVERSGQLEDGDTFVYTRPDSMIGKLSYSMQIVLATSDENHFYTIGFTNDCDAWPVLEEGQTIGALEIIGVGPPQSPEMCPAFTTPAPSSIPTPVSTPTPSYIPTLEACSDDPNFERKSGQDCAWVAENPQSRCALDDDIPAACQRTCKAECKCVNDPYFMHNKDFKQEGCNWVKDNLNRCNLDGVGTSCPEVCNRHCTNECSNDRYFMRNNDPQKSCDWIMEKPTSRCDLDSGHVGLSCPATCNSGCCKDTRKFKWNGDPEKDCNWVAKNAEVRCPKRSSTGESVADHCPSVCNSFCSQRKNLRG